MKLYIIDYFTADGTLGDCYPDFCYSQAEAETIAPQFMHELDWATSWAIRVDDSDDDSDGPMRYIVRDTATQGCDFLLWGDDNLTAAIVSLCLCHCDGIGHDVELVAMPADAMDAHTRKLIEG